MKKYILSLVLLCGVVVAHAQDEWTNVQEPAFSGFISDINFVSPTTGWAVGTGGQIYKTTDAGFTWESQGENYESAASLGLNTVFFLDENTGWVGATQGIVLKTTDGGATWSSYSITEEIPHITVNQFRGLQFVNEDTGYLISGANRHLFIFRSDDGGESWAVQDSIVGENWLAMDFYDANKGVLVGENNNTQRYTSDGGVTWLASDATPSVSRLSSLNAVKWVGENDVVAIGQGNSFQGLATPVLKSTDGGATWEMQTFNTPDMQDVFLGLEFHTDGRLVAMGHNRTTTGVVATSADFGETWDVITTNLNVQLQSFSAVGEELFIQGSSSHILYSSDFGQNLEFRPVNPYSEIRSINFIGENGYFMNANSGLFKQAGDHWEYVSHAGLFEPGRGNNLYFLDETTAIVHKYNRHILKTTDAGQTWDVVLDAVPHNANNRSGGVAFLDGTTGYAWLSQNTATAHALYKTEDAGDSWTEHSTFTAPATVAGEIHFFDENTGFIAGPRRWVYNTTNGGADFSEQIVADGFPDGFSATADFRAVAMLSETEAFAVGNGFIVKTEDAGATWTWVDVDVTDTDLNFYAVAFVNENVGYAGSFDGSIVYTQNGGETWVADNEHRGTLRFITAGTDGSRIFLGTTTGQVLSKKAVATSIEHPGKELAAAVRLQQNYPNPFNPSTSIRFELPQQASVSLKVYDVTGRIVATLLDGAEYAGGTHTVNFDARHLSSGLYIYELMIPGNQRLTRSMTLIK